MIMLLLMLAQVDTGLDVIAADGFKVFQGKSIAMLTNHSALDKNGVHLTRLLQNARIPITVFLAPEHGFHGTLDQENIADGADQNTGVKIYSLYGKHRKPTPEMLAGVDLLVFDIQDIGTRFYTYQTTMLYAMEACLRNGVAFMVLDRPNPLGGERVLGPSLDPDKKSFTGAFPMPVVHGMTMGELAKMFKAELFPKLKLEVVPVQGWKRSDLFDQTGLVWINPSPNMRNLTQAILYPAIGLLERTNISVGRGTDEPFERFGAPWLEPVSFCRQLNQTGLPGVSFIPRFFTPESGPYKDERCGGVQIMLRDRQTFRPILTAYTIFQHLKKHGGQAYHNEPMIKLLANQSVFDDLMVGRQPQLIIADSEKALDAFRKKRAQYLIYK